MGDVSLWKPTSIGQHGLLSTIKSPSWDGAEGHLGTADRREYNKTLAAMVSQERERLSCQGMFADTAYDRALDWRISLDVPVGDIFAGNTLALAAQPMTDWTVGLYLRAGVEALPADSHWATAITSARQFRDSLGLGPVDAVQAAVGMHAVLSQKATPQEPGYGAALA